MRGTAREVVDRMGLTARIRAECVREQGMAYVDVRGRVRSRMPVHAFDGEGVVADIEIERGDLARLLYEETRADVEYLFDDSIETLTQTGDGVRLTFARSAPRTVGLVVGADGSHSRTRALAFGPESAYVRPLGATRRCCGRTWRAGRKFRVEASPASCRRPGPRFACATQLCAR